MGEYYTFGGKRLTREEVDALSDEAKEFVVLTITTDVEPGGVAAGDGPRQDGPPARPFTSGGVVGRWQDEHGVWHACTRCRSSRCAGHGRTLTVSLKAQRGS